MIRAWFAYCAVLVGLGCQGATETLDVDIYSTTALSSLTLAVTIDGDEKPMRQLAKEGGAPSLPEHAVLLLPKG